MKILIEGIDVLTANSAEDYIKNVDIGIEEDRISFIVPAGSAPVHFKADKKFCGKLKIAMPGLVNAHTHCGMTTMRNSADDLPLHKWLFEKIFPIEAKMTDDDVYENRNLLFIISEI